MTQDHIQKLQNVVTNRFLTNIREHMGTSRSGKKLDRAILRWHEICRELGMERTHEPDPEKITVTDPSPGGTYLQMTRDHALLILTLGLP